MIRRVIITIKNHRSQLTRPSLSANEYLAMLEKQKLFKTVAFLREHESNLWNGRDALLHLADTRKSG